MGNINKRQKYAGYEQLEDPSTPPPQPPPQPSPQVPLIEPLQPDEPVVQDVHIPDWSEIDPKAKRPPKPGKPMRKIYRHYVQKNKYDLEPNTPRISDIRFMWRIGAGGEREPRLGTVWLCSMSKADEKNRMKTIEVACKVMTIQTYQHMSLVEATAEMMREANIVKELVHPHIVKSELVIHIDDQSQRRSGFPYMHVLLFMEFFNYDLLVYMAKINRPMAEDTAYNWFVQIADALRYLHYDRRIAHINIKPRNIMIKKVPKERFFDHNIRFVTVKLTDFAYARRFDEGEFTSINQMMGVTGEYMAPEAAAGMLFDACRADIYSFGVTLAHTLTNYELAKRNELVTAIQFMDSVEYPDINRGYVIHHWGLSHALIDLLRGMLEMDPNQRFDINKVWFSEWVSQKAYASGVPFYLPPP